MNSTRATSARWAAAAMVGSAACWGGATTMTKGALDALPPFTLLTLQLTASVIFLWALALLTGRRAPATRRSAAAALTGLLEPGLSYGLGVPGLALTSAATASVIGAAEPALVCLLAWGLLRDKLPPRLTLAVVLAGAGVAMVAMADFGLTGDRTLIGDLLVLAGTLTAAFYVIGSSRLGGGLGPLPLAALQQSVGLAFAALLLAVALATGSERLPKALSGEMLLLAAVSGVVQYALAFWLYLVGLRAMPASRAALFLALIPVFGVAAAALFLGERPGLLALAGCAVVTAAVATTARR